ncbi:MAG TPA: hypothetical protein DC042_10340 [Bacteroidales bacterium]|nr:hypothetical protein [Bacteroidales bacterium]
MKARILVWILGLLFLSAAVPLSSQNLTQYKSGNSQKVLKNTTIQIKAESYRGMLQWQWSQDTLLWEDLADQTREILTQTIKSDIYFRVGVKENTCDWLYSDFIKYIPIEPATINTYPVTDIGIYVATASGEIMDSGNDTIRMAGICYGLAPNPDTTGLKIQTESASWIFQLLLSGLQPNTNYYVRAFAVNDAGISYGSQTIFTTMVGFPEIVTDTVTQISDSSAILTASFILPGGGTAFEAGFYWGTDENPELSGSYFSLEPETNPFSVLISGLSPNILYFVKAFVANEAGVSYSENYQFTTLLRTPFVLTSPESETTATTCIVSGEVIDEGGGTVSAKGICWDLSPSPDTTYAIRDIEAGIGGFSCFLDNLRNNTTYYYRAFAANETGIGFGETFTFTTLAEVPSVVTDTVTNINTTSGIAKGEIMYNGGAPVLTKGVCWSLGPEPDISGNKVTSTFNSDKFSVSITGLLPNTTYHYRAYATNLEGTGYGADKVFKTRVSLPAVTTTAATSITYKRAVVGGNVTSTGNGTIIKRGICWSRETNPTLQDSIFLIGQGGGIYNGVLTGLTHNVKYYAKAFCINEVDTAYGSQINFTTPSAPPIVKTVSFYDLTSYNCRADGQIVETGGSPITKKGICWGPNPYPDISGEHTEDGSGPDDFTGLLTDLAANRKYYFRAYATTSAGTSYGNANFFKTPDDGNYADIPVLSDNLRASFRGWSGLFPDKGTALSQGYSGVTYDWERNQVLIIGNNALHIWVIEAPGYGKWSDNNPSGGFVRAIKLDGFVDTEAINYLGNSWIMIAEEIERKIYFFQIDESTLTISKTSAAVTVDPTELFSASEVKNASTSNMLEGIAFDFHNRKIYALCEIGPNNYPRLFMWDWDEVNKKVLVGSRAEITTRFQDLSTDFPAASDLFYSPLLKRLYIVDGSSNKLGEWDCSDPGSINFGRRLATMQEPLSNGTTGNDLGDLEGFGISDDGLYCYMCFEDKSFGYAIAPLVRNLPNNNLPSNLYPFNGTPGTWTSDDDPALNDPTVYLSRFKSTSDFIDTTLLNLQMYPIHGYNDTLLTNLSDLAFDESNDRLCVVTRTDAVNDQVSYLNFFDMDGSYAGKHTLERAFATNPDGTNLPNLSRSIITGVLIRPHTNLMIRWLSGPDGSVQEVTVDGLAGPQLIGNPVTDPLVMQVGNGQGYGTSTANTYESLAADFVHRDCIWTTKQVSYNLEEYRGGILHRTIGFGGFPVPGTGKTVSQLMTHITGLYYDDLSDHLFIGGYNSSTGACYIIEMKMLDKTVMGHLQLRVANGLEGFTFNENLTQLAVLYKNSGQRIQIFKK